jgi:hypothetical protein
LVPVLGGKQPLKPGWAIHGKVHRSIVFEKNPLAVADELVRGRSLPPQSVKLHLREDVKWNEVVVTCDPAFATVAIKQPLQPMKHAEAELNFNPNLPAGLFSFPVKFSTSIPQEKAPTVLTITGTVRECVEAKPSILILPPKPLSEKGTGLVTLTAFDQTPFSVQRVETSGPEVVVSQTDHPQVYRIDVDYSMPGQNSATVFFFCKLPKEQRDAKVLCVIKYFAMGTK